MTIVTKNELSSEDFFLLKECSWSGALQTLEYIEDANKQSEFMDYLEAIFEDEVDSTELNDFIWFESDTIFEALGLDENGRPIDDDDDDDGE